LQKFQDKRVLLAWQHQALYDRGGNGVFYLVCKIHGLIITEAGFNFDYRRTRVEYVACKAQSQFIDSLHLKFAAITLAPRGHGLPIACFGPMGRNAIDLVNPVDVKILKPRFDAALYCDVSWWGRGSVLSMS
jgi:hypothetical protein